MNDRPGFDASDAQASATRRREPGLVAVFDAGHPVMQVVPLAGRHAELGRLSEGLRELREDPLISRRHVEIRVEGKVWLVSDLGSHNGTFVNAARRDQTVAIARDQRLVLRLGHRLLVGARDVVPYRGRQVVVDGTWIMGPLLAALRERARPAVRAGASLLFTGEPGVGKHRFARELHVAATRAGAPFVVLDGANLDEVSLDSYMQRARGGTLLVNDAGAIRPGVLAALAVRRMHSLQTGSGGTRLWFSAAAPVALPGFAPTILHLPPVRGRLDEVPWLVTQALAAVDPRLFAHWSLIEACLLRAWPGNLRELLAAVRHAGMLARCGGHATVRALHLPPETLVTPVPVQFPDGSGLAIDKQLIEAAGGDAEESYEVPGDGM
jgi:hypothetical protein